MRENLGPVADEIKVINTKYLPFGLKPKAETLFTPFTMTLLSEFLVRVSGLEVVGTAGVTVANGEEPTNRLTRGSLNSPVLVHPQVGDERVPVITTDTSRDRVTPLAVVPVILKVNVPGDGEAVVVTFSVDETEPVEGTVTC